MRRSTPVKFAFLASSLFLVLGSMSCSKDDGGGGLSGKCKEIDEHPVPAAAVSFATAVYPILSNTMVAVGCSQATICHGTPPSPIDTGTPAKTLSFVDGAAAVKTTLLSAVPVNAPGMKFVVPGDVGASFLAHKISGADGLACANAMCVSGASLGASKPCGDPMPTLGMLTAAERTTILDWIAKGAAD